jgi:hypothetical protein
MVGCFENSDVFSDFIKVVIFLTIRKTMTFIFAPLLKCHAMNIYGGGRRSTAPRVLGSRRK